MMHTLDLNIYIYIYEIPYNNYNKNNILVFQKFQKL